jgi:Ca-activated chloride channel family protein
MLNFATFHFLRPYWFLALIPMLAFLWLYMKRRQLSGSWSAVCDPRLLPHILLGAEKKQNRWQVVLIGIAGLISIIALAGPAWKQLPQPVFRDQSSLVIVLDLSRSMDATDIRPSRLIRARLKILDILRQRKEGQTALVVYAGKAFTVTPLTQDTNTISALVNTLATDLMPEQGSRSSVALQQAMDLLQQAGINRGDVLLVTDGIDDSAATAAVKALVNHGHRLSILGVGTKMGAPIPAEEGGFIKDDKGGIVIPKLDDAQLQALSHLGGGTYQHISTDDRDINAFTREFTKLQDHNVKNASKSQLNVQADLWREEGPWLLLLVIPFAAIVFRRGYLVLLVALVLPVPHNAYAFGWDDLWRTPDQQAARAFDNGKPKQAAGLFKDKQWQGAANYRANNYQETVQDLDGINTPDALYNKANALARLGQLKQAIDTYDQALKLDPKHADAKYNRDLLKKYMQKQKNQQQKQDKRKSQDDKGQGKRAQQQSPGQDQQQQSGQQDKDKNAQQQKGNTPQQQQDQNNSQQARADQQHQQQADKHDMQQQQKQEAQEAQKQQQDASQADAKQLSPEDAKKQEQQLANEQWLRRIPDDPGGLLRRKFLYQSQRNQEKSDQQDRRLQPW